MIREIRHADNEQLVIKIPKEYIHQELEILVFPISENAAEIAKNATPDAAENLKKFRLLMKKAKKSNIRIPKDVDIDDLIDEINNDIY